MGNAGQSWGQSPSLGFVSFGIPNSKKIQMTQINKKSWNQITQNKKRRKKTKSTFVGQYSILYTILFFLQKEKKENKVNICRSTFNTIHNIIFLAVICFAWREQLLYILLRSSYFIIALTATFLIWLLNLLWRYFFLPFVGVSFNFITQ